PVAAGARHLHRGGTVVLKNKTPVGAGVRSGTGAGNETRTRDPDLGKVVLYQLSYSRVRRRILPARNSMSRTFGHRRRLTCGFSLRAGDVCVVGTHVRPGRT